MIVRKETSSSTLPTTTPEARGPDSPEIVQSSENGSMPREAEGGRKRTTWGHQCR
eukprot:CAMPEP_0194773182 /NCGR_PEP_ID=MMETSP0323_2-20130528/54125_1 /TAXON_ID=2866 ORGANISM="Crypthecodinium cohnii, Strain Seligo" /NCGR_SAMPLE_ID=MMETSP0323_2 /ASSEMBLY_ACC=CAM_ASM_000346 /LENGTH=54 /DNA_ID=CAMNT_0039708095 /DNA_START=86 /DNA_END=246 /DNA_ORIENTATION=-